MVQQNHQSTCLVQASAEVSRISCSTDLPLLQGIQQAQPSNRALVGEQHPGICLEVQQGREAHLCTTRK